MGRQRWNLISSVHSLMGSLEDRGVGDARSHRDDDRREIRVGGGDIKGQSFLVSGRLTIRHKGGQGQAGGGWGGVGGASHLVSNCHEQLGFYLQSGDRKAVLYLTSERLHVGRVSLSLSRFSRRSSKSCQQIRGAMTRGPISPSTDLDRSAAATR